MSAFRNHRIRQPKSGSLKQKALRRSPLLAGTERRARFSYDDLLELFSLMECCETSRPLRHQLRFGQLSLALKFLRALVVTTPTMPLMKVAFLVARLEHAPVL